MTRDLERRIDDLEERAEEDEDEPRSLAEILSEGTIEEDDQR